MELRKGLKEIIDNAPEDMNHIGIINNNAEFMNNKVGTVHCIEDVKLILELQTEIEALKLSNNKIKLQTLFEQRMHFEGYGAIEIAVNEYYELVEQTLKDNNNE